jgi:hypothetical protein
MVHSFALQFRLRDLLGAALRARQLGIVKSKCATDSANSLRLELLTVTEQRKGRRAALPMHDEHGMAVRTPSLIVRLKTATTLSEPLAKCGAFHGLFLRYRLTHSNVMKDITKRFES